MSEAIGHVDVIVVGGGISGLSTARKLSGRSVLVLEQGIEFGGNAGMRQHQGLRYPIAGSCFQDPIKGSETAALLNDLGLWKKWRRTDQDLLVLFDTQHLLRALGEVTLALLKQPKELLNPAVWGLTYNLCAAAITRKKFVVASKKLGDPVFADLYTYLDRFKPISGKYPAMPWHDTCAWTRTEMELFDSISLHDLFCNTTVRAQLPAALVPPGKYGKLVMDAIETTLRVECLTTKDVSAYVGLHFLVGYLRGTLVTLPGGNGHVVEKLKNVLGQQENCHLRNQAHVTSVNLENGCYRVDFEQNGERLYAVARSVIWAAPKYAAIDTIRHLPPAQQAAIQQINHRDYCVATIFLKQAALKEYTGGYVIEGNAAADYPQSWCRSSVCVVANWMDIDFDGDTGVLTLLKPISSKSDQGRLAQIPFDTLQKITYDEVCEILQAKGFSPDIIKDIKLWRWQRALVVTTVGQLKDNIFARASNAVGGVFFANQDSVGVGNLESAVTAAFRAAEQVEAYLMRQDRIIRDSAHATSQLLQTQH